MMESYQRFTQTKIIGLIICILLYAMLNYFFVGFRMDHLYLILLVTALFFISDLTQKLLFGLIFFVIFFIVYDTTRIYPNYMVNEVHIEDLYNLEKSLFGIETSAGILTPNEYFKERTHTFLDVMSGLFYLSWVPVPILFSIFLFFKNKKWILYFSFAFLMMNLIGFTCYYIYPAAPPWYVEFHGFEKQFNIPGNEAGLTGFDNFFGVDLFKDMYAKNANVFAAMPSLHSANPVILVWFAIRTRMKGFTFLFSFLMCGIWFAAVYLRHHYILDVAAGLACSLTAIAAFEFLIRKTRLKDALDGLAQYISRP